MSAHQLKKEVLKVDVERLRYLAMNEEYDNCFECQSREDFIESLRKTPEEGFMNSYQYWFSIPNQDVYDRVIEMWGESIFDEYFCTNKSATSELKDKIESTINRIKNGEIINNYIV